MVNYQNSFIYKLCCKNTTIEDIYIGSTTNFKERKRAHKTNCNNENNRNYNINVYKFIRNHGGFNNWDMILIEKVKCNDKMELCKIEREYIEKTENNLNKVIPIRSHKESCQIYRDNNKEKEKERHRLYRENNKEKEKERHRLYRENNIEKEKERHKLYSEKNKIIINEKSKIYYEKNKDIIKEKAKIKINCECGSTFRKDTIQIHNKTIKHQKYIKEKELILNV